MSFPKINATLADADRDKILADIKESWTLMPFMINITDDEKKAIPKMGQVNIGWVQKALDYAAANPKLVPPYLNVGDLNCEVSLAEQLSPIFEAVNQLASALDSTYAVVGSEAYVTALSFYNSVRDAAKRDVPGAKAIYDDLQKRFPGHPKGNANPQSQAKP